jgi:beta-galactosidase
MRDVSSVIAVGGQGFYFYDMFGSWFHEPEAMATIRKAFAMNTHATKYAGMYEKPSVAIVMDEKTRLLAETTAYATPNAIWRTSGLTPAMHLLSDIDGEFPGYKLCILWNPVSITKAQAAKLKKAAAAGTKVVLAGRIGICSREFASPDEALAALGEGVEHIENVESITDVKLNELARSAGARVYSDPGNVTYVGNGVAAVHRIAGPATVDFGREVTPVDPLTGRLGRPLRYWKPDLPLKGVATMCYLP